MKVIIAGSRTFHDYQLLLNAIQRFQREVGPITEIVSGGAKGADSLGERWAREHQVPVKVFLPDWDAHGPAAGPKRNQQMIDYVGKEGGLIAIWVNRSRGTKDTIFRARKSGLPPRHVQVEEIGSQGREETPSLGI